MGKRKNRSRAMVIAAKRRSARPLALTGALGAEAFATAPGKIRFDLANDDEDDCCGEGLVSVPPPPPTNPELAGAHMSPASVSSGRVIELPRTNSPWFSRTLNASAVTHFEEYYRRQNILPDESEWGAFLGHLRRPLPVTFRLSAMASHRTGVEEALSEGRDVLRPPRRILADSGRVVPPPLKLEWCGGYQLGCDKITLKYGRDPALRETQRWLVRHNSTGVLTRQAVDSMVPAAILGVEPGHMVLDMCASPGSKTTQLLEALCAGGLEHDPDGCVVANDINPRRCYFLVRRCAALGAATRALVVTNHHAQWFPNDGVPAAEAVGIANQDRHGRWPPTPGIAPFASSAVREKTTGAGLPFGRYPAGTFDRIICDVPCSGDGTLRKNPQIWSEWRPEFAMGLHALQLRIAQRGAALLRVGGYMVYSTCSFNPVENEAVVAELVRRCGGALEIVDASDRVRGLERRPGMKTWKVITMVDDNIVEYPTFEDSQKSEVSVGLRRKFERSMWPPRVRGANRLGVRMKGPPLERCMRLMPHDQDMGGFFATLLRKIAPLPGPKPTRESMRRAMETDSPGTGAGSGLGGAPPGGFPRPVAEHRYVPVSDAILKRIAEEWDMRAPSFVSNFASRLFARSQKCRSLTYMAPGVIERCVSSDGAARMKVVWGGVKVWERRGTAAGEHYRAPTDSKGVEALVDGTGTFEWRLTQEGAVLLARHAGDKRRLLLPARDLKQLLLELGKDVPLNAFTPATEAAARSISPGSCIVELKRGGNFAGDDAFLPLAAERTVKGTLRIDWRYRKGLEGAPKAAASAILRRLDAI